MFACAEVHDSFPAAARIRRSFCVSLPSLQPIDGDHNGITGIRQTFKGYICGIGSRTVGWSKNLNIGTERRHSHSKQKGRRPNDVANTLLHAQNRKYHSRKPGPPNPKLTEPRTAAFRLLVRFSSVAPHSPRQFGPHYF